MMPDSPEIAGPSHFMQGLEQWVSLRSSARPQADQAAEPLEAQSLPRQSSIGAQGASLVMPTTPNVFLEETPRFRRLLQDVRDYTVYRRLCSRGSHLPVTKVWHCLSGPATGSKRQSFRP